MKKAIIIVVSSIIILLAIFAVIKFNKAETIEDKVEKTLKNMSLEEKIAQMLVLYYDDEIVDETLENIIKTYSPGGFIINTTNLSSLEGAKKYVSDIKKLSKITPIIAIDEEGGTVDRISSLNEASTFPDMKDLGNTKNEELAYKLGKAIAEELRVIGVNVNFAPVLDIDNAKEDSFMKYRSLSSDKEIVSKLGIKFASALEDNNVIATYKHFPGHGDTSTDSHTEMPVINKTLEELMDNELVPFKNAINNNAKLIMVGHINIPSLSKEPATLSKEIVTDLLKDKLGYKGLVITDALNMGAITNIYSEKDIYIKSIEAGCDILLMPTSSKSAISIIKENISEERINESVRKILLFKYKYLEDYKTLDNSYLNNNEHKTIINDIKSFEK